MLVQYLIYSEADFEVFRPTEATHCTDGVKFGKQAGTFGFLLATPGLDIGAPKLKYLLRLDQNVEYKRPTEAYSLRDFHNICRV